MAANVTLVNEEGVVDLFKSPLPEMDSDVTLEGVCGRGGKIALLALVRLSTRVLVHVTAEVRHCVVTFVAEFALVLFPAILGSWKGYTAFFVVMREILQTLEGGDGTGGTRDIRFRAVDLNRVGVQIGEVGELVCCRHVSGAD